MLTVICLCVLLVSCHSQQTYCIASVGPSTTLDSNLGPVRLTGNTLAINDSTDCPGTQGVQDFTSQVADLSPLNTYTLTFQQSTCGGTYPTLAGAWIDFNGDKSWTDNEKLGDYSGEKGLISYTFSVPSDARLGTTRMRVQVQETYQLSIDPCGAFNYGGTKDFGINIAGNIPGCSSGPATTQDMNLGQVYLYGDIQDIIDLTDCPGSIGPVDLRNQVADVVRGNRYSIQYNVTTCGDTWNVLSGVWFDWSRDGKFTNDELAFSLTNETGLVTRSFTIPEGSYYGNITMRVQVQETFSSTIDPCSDFPYGGTKDFTLRLKDQSETYCQSGPTQTGSSVLGAIRLVGQTQTIVNNDACPGTQGPQDLTTQFADLNIGGAYTLTYTVTNCSAPTQITTSAWIDYDQNFQFSDWEQILVNNHAYGTFSSLFKVPISTSTQIVKTGRTRIRIQTQETTASSINACTEFQFGGTKDASITILASVEDI